MKYGLIVDDGMICDPISDHPRLLDIAARQGFPVHDIRTPLTAAITLELAGRILRLWPEKETMSPPPEPVGFSGQFSAWQTDTEQECISREYKYQPMKFEEAVEDLQQHISRQQDTALAVLESGYTEQEVKTWMRQQAEAAAWMADNTAPIPLIEGLALRRGVTVAAVVEKINAKVTAAATMTGIVLGDAQAAGDQINALKAQYDSSALPDDWFDRLQAMASGWRKDWPPELM